MSLYQHDVLAYLQGRGATPTADHRWNFYEEAYLGRIASALSSTLLERTSYLFGESFIQTLISDFVREHPAQHPIMPELLRGFADWLDVRGWNETHPELVALVRLALLRWDVLVGDDPDPVATDWEDKRLQRNHGLQLSALPLYDLWWAPTGTEIPMAAQGVLFYKSSPITLECVLVPIELSVFARQLSCGLSLYEALEQAEASPALTAFISQLIRTAAL